MIELNGKYNFAKVFTDNIDNETISQIINLCNQEFIQGSVVRIMPDTHAGESSTIGTTFTIKDKVVPNLVSGDIGCGMETIKLKNKHIEFGKLDKIIRQYVPSGYEIRKKQHSFVDKIDIENLICKKNVDLNKAYLSIGTLGGGNHFIEVNRDIDGYLYLVIHSGSRHLGGEVAKFYQNLAIKSLTDIRDVKLQLAEQLKSQGRQQEINDELKKIIKPKINKAFAYLEGTNLDNYLHDMKIAQDFATWNRKAMADVIIREMKLKPIEQFTTIHNYINTDDMILRKGAISARKDEKVLIPINMRDGSIIAIGKGNEDWNFSAPHGAGRLMSRSKAKENISMSDYKDSMKDVWTTSVSINTIDESPMAYKPIDEILENIKDTVDVIDIIEPVYNFKAS